MECEGPGEYSFDNPPYIQIDSGMLGCASRPDGVVECSNGSAYDFGEPLRDFAVATLPADYRLFFEGTPDERWVPVYAEPEDLPHICAITESNAIRCVGFRYDFPDLQEALPRGE